MDPRWGASGRRISMTLDVRFREILCTDERFLNAVVKDNLGGESSAIYELETAAKARLRKGFDEMNCYGGCYRLDVNKKNGAATVRFNILVDGTPETGSSYGDVYVPKGFLYFSLPAFGGKISQLSQKDGPVTVRQIGWHTGWRRMESRIVGTFKAARLISAKKRDGF